MIDPTKAKCWDKDWKYVRSESTDLEETFKRIRKAMKKSARPADDSHVVQLRKGSPK